MKFRLVQCIEGQFVVSEFDENNVLAAMDVRGFVLAGVNENRHHRAELQGAPIFSDVCGPMWDGDAIRYEDRAAYARLSA